MLNFKATIYIFNDLAMFNDDVRLYLEDITIKGGFVIS